MRKRRRKQLEDIKVTGLSKVIKEKEVLKDINLDEYRKHIEKDSALERRFQPVLVDEPSVEETIEILRGIKDYYESYHRLKYPMR